ncbi:MAG: DNA polymerase III subunit delta' [Cyanobacteria bacterium P01_A01_bin.84]
MNPFTKLIGQHQAVELLTQAVLLQRVAPAYLFVGTNGIGRSLAAHCFVEFLFTRRLDNPESVIRKLEKGNHPDVLWVEPTYQHQGQLLTSKQAEEKGLKCKAPPTIRLEQIRAITEFLSRPPMSAPRNIVVLEQTETMAESASNALLKTLEEPGQATIILIAPSPESILSTLVSRSQKIPFSCLNSNDMSQVLIKTGNEEIIEHPTILKVASGSPGYAIESYQQLQTIPSELLLSLTRLPQNYRQALELAKQVDKQLDTETQLWLVSYLQHLYWQNNTSLNIIKQLENAKKALLSYAQPRLVWECTFLDFVKINNHATFSGHN